MSYSNTSSTTNTADSWNSYWRGDTSSHAYSSSGVNHPVLTAYWQSLFHELHKQGSTSTMIDVASGNGALPELALSIFDQDSIEITAVDVSTAAIENISNRFPAITGIVADANKLDLGDQRYDLVSSQFGIEYAGLNAIDNVVDLVNPGGMLNFMLHADGSAIGQECELNRDALLKLIEMDFIGLASNMFKHGFEAVAGADRQHYDKAAQEIAAVLPKVESLIETYGQDISGGLIVQLYNDIGKIHSRMPHYHADDILPWLERMQEEASAYLERMQSMLNASLDQQQFDLICDKLTGTSFLLEHHTILTDPQTSAPLAWVLQARKII